MITTLGLSLIILGWAYQAWRLFRDSRAIQPIFAFLYALGVFFLVVGDSLAINFKNFLSLNGFSFILAVIVLTLILLKKK